MKSAIDTAVDKFLGWKLPVDFSPDCYIMFKHPGGNGSWPTGTNLLTAMQARAMFEHCFGDAAPPPPPVMCGNCDSPLPIGCGGLFKSDGDLCRYGKNLTDWSAA